MRKAWELGVLCVELEMEIMKSSTNHSFSAHFAVEILGPSWVLSLSAVMGKDAFSRSCHLITFCSYVLQVQSMHISPIIHSFISSLP